MNPIFVLQNETMKYEHVAKKVRFNEMIDI